ncbi:MAG TPA: DegQ family serine endoprotease [Alphaproteobacteria bacterium]|nr:DegQ family serine endoprotease [Alphaproteobacteria bacterium]
MKDRPGMKRGGWWEAWRRPLGAAALALAALLAAATASAADRAVPQSREQIRFSFAPVVKMAAPAVVNIYTRTVVDEPSSPLLADPFFRRFFGDQFMGGVPRKRIQNALGSGVIVGKDGTIVTNDHVIKGAEQITVVLPDRREFAAKVVGTDPRADIAVLHIDNHGAPLPVLEYGDSDAVEVGDLVLAIGNPFGVGQTVTSGIVSALARTTAGVSDYNFFIQTDAAINPGNSGGALVTMDGKLVGINTAIYSRSGGSVGIGFAIPSNMVRVVVASILSGGKIERPWLGAKGESVNPDIASSLGLSRPDGVLVNQVYRGGPADMAGLKPGDVVLEFDGRAVDDADTLRYRVATKPVNTTATLTVWRRGRELELPIGLNAPPAIPAPDKTRLGGAFPLSGAVVVNISPATADELGLDPFEHGVAVSAVSPDTEAAELGVKPGDVILSVNGTALRSIDDLRRVVESQPSQWRLSFRRGDRTLNVVIGS